MTITEAARQHMIAALEAELGTEAAMTLIEHLPPSGWSHIDDRFDGIDRRLDGVEHRLDGVEHRLDGVEHRLDGVEQRLAALSDQCEHEFAAIEHRFAAVDYRFDTLHNYISSQFDQRSIQMSSEFAAQSRSIMFAFVTSLIGFGGLMIAAVSIVH